LRALCLVSLWQLAFPFGQAAAFCRESLQSQSSGPCDSDPGVPFLFWKRNCMTQTFNAQFLAPHRANLSEGGSLKLFSDSLTPWREGQAWPHFAAADDCDGRKPFS